MRSDFGRTSAANRAAGRRFSARAALYNLYYLFNISKSSILLFDLDHHQFGLALGTNLVAQVPVPPLTMAAQAGVICFMP